MDIFSDFTVNSVVRHRKIFLQKNFTNEKISGPVWPVRDCSKQKLESMRRKYHIMMGSCLAVVMGWSW